MAEGDFVREREMGKKMDRNSESLSNSESENDSISRISSLVASKDRDFLLSPNEKQVKVSRLEGKIVGLYFSGNWDPQCRNFTHLLANVYKQLRSEGSELEIVFVSCDEDIDAFNDYRAHMPWLSIPYSDMEVKKALNQRFNIEGMPCLVILQPKCGKDEVELRDGVELVYRYGVRAFPFTKERLEDLQRENREKHEKQNITNLLTKQNRDFLLGHPSSKKNVQIPVASLIGKTIGLYFSAQWCNPAVKFTPKLISTYNTIKQTLSKDEGFEIILVSSDLDQSAFDAYFSIMPWLALPFGDATIKELVKHFEIGAIPCLVIVGPNGKTLTKQGRSLLNVYQENAYPFTPEKLELLRRKADEEVKMLPKFENHLGHPHELTLVSDGNTGGSFICCDCDEQGLGWAYQCIKCGYEVHPKCMRSLDHGSGLNLSPRLGPTQI